MIDQNEWFYRILEIRKFPQTVTQEEVLKMADDLVLSFFGESSLHKKLVNFGLNKAAEVTLNNTDD
jgi:hypothetical protein